MFEIDGQDEDFVVEMTERQEIEARSFAGAMQGMMGDEAYEEFVLDMIEASEESLRRKDSKAARYCLKLLEDRRKVQERGFE